ncbi:MAG: flippase-like domain-containing protein [Treponema sp.]|nr:flippase-like domain-containing protein [Treponema sp.]
MKKKVFWALFTLCLSILTIFSLFYSGDLSVPELLQKVKEASPEWLIPAAICTLGFIFFEGLSLVLILRTLGYPAKKRRGFLYSSADIYFSSITPSATGGQPASAFFMRKDGVSGAAITVSLILNLTMYTLAIITLGLFSIIFFPGIFLDFALPCKIMILIGVAMMSLLTAFFILLLKKQAILLKICNVIVSIIERLNFKKAAERFRRGIDSTLEKYRECVETLGDKKAIFVKTYLLNILQRASQILVTVFCYYAMHGNIPNGLKIFAIQTYVVIGSNFIPIPGAVGISEFLMYFGYESLIGGEASCSLAILSRGISFYTCSAISIFTVILGFILLRQKKNKKENL